MKAPAQQKLLDDLPLDRSVFPHQFDVTRDQVLLVRIPGDIQSEAAFLDERVLSPKSEGAWFPWDRVAAPGARLSGRRPRCIFHMGHCGSTLISRLISAVTGALALREPLPLRTFAFDAAEGAGAFLDDARFAERFLFFEHCWARGPAPVIVKATSICTDLAVKIAMKETPALFLYQAPETHLAALLAGANTLADLRGFAQMRHRRLRRFCPVPPLAAASLGELAAQSWLCEARAAMAAHDDERLALVNFESFLAAPASELAKACRVFELTPDDEKIANALAGPIMKTYSKAPEHAYSPATRRQIITEAAKTHRHDIRQGMAFLETAAQESEPVARTLRLFSR